MEEQLANITGVDLVSKGSEDRVKEWADGLNLLKHIESDIDDVLVVDHHPRKAKDVRSKIKSDVDGADIEFRGQMRSVITSE